MTQEDDGSVWSDLRAMWNEEGEKEKPQREAWAYPAMDQITKLTDELTSAGWKEICYCPKDGSMFLAWTPIMATPFICSYAGKWPDGSWFGHMDGDSWPVQPVLFKEMPDE